MSRTRRSPPRPELSVVVPLYNEAESLGPLYRRTTEALEGVVSDFELILVDDGSTDATPAILARLCDADPRVHIVELSRNFGHQAAVSAGLELARGRAVAVMDGDLQDPPELLPAFLEAWRDGFEVVYAVRRRRREAWPKRLAYRAFYRLLRFLSDVEIPLDSGDFGLMDRRVVRELRRLPERMRFVRGLRSFVGFRQVGIPYDRPERGAGRSKYSARALLRLAIDGLVSFSGAPLRWVTYLGLFSALLALAMIAWALRDALVHHTAPRGWASTIIAVLMMGSAQMLSLGIVGAYIRRIFLEVKGRPTYIIRSRRSTRRGRPTAAATPHGRARTAQRFSG